MNLKEEVIMLERDFQNRLEEAIDAATMKTITPIIPPKFGNDIPYANKSFDEKTKALSDMFRAGRYLRKVIVDNDDGKGGNLFEPAVRQKLEIRIMNGFKQLYKLIDALTAEVRKEEDKSNVDMRKVIRKDTVVQSRDAAAKSRETVTEAYFSQDMKKAIEPEITKLMKSYGMTGRLSINNHSTVVLNVREGKIDFENEYNTDKKWNGGESRKWNGYVQSANYHIDTTWKKDSNAQKFLTSAYKILNRNNHDNSDIQTDYFDVGFYVSINIGTWDKPYVYTGVKKATSSPKPVVKKQTKPQDKFLLMIADKFGELSEYLEDSTKDTFLDQVHTSVEQIQYIAIATLINEVEHCVDVNEFYNHLETENKTLANTLDEKTMNMVIGLAKKL